MTRTLAGLKVLVVEDDPLISLLLEEMLDGLGCALFGAAATVEQAMAHVQGDDVPEAVILDLNLNGRSSKPVALALVEAGVPLVLASGYGAGALDDLGVSPVVLEKPFTQKQVGDALTEALGA